MRILVVSNLYPPRVIGGYEIGCQKFVNAMRERGHDVRVITSPAAETPDEPQDHVERVLAIDAYTAALDEAPTPALHAAKMHEAMVSQWANTLLVLDALRRFRPDQVVFFNLVGIGGLAIVDLVHRLGAPWTFDLGDAVPAHLVVGLPPEERVIFGAPELFAAGRHAAVSRNLVDEIEGAGVPLGASVSIIPVGVDPLFVRSHERPYRDGGVTRFVFAGKLHSSKGTDLILDAVAAIPEERRARILVDCYGPGDPAPLRAALDQRGLGERVSVGGLLHQEQLAEEFSRADAFLFPTLERESLGLAPFEAAAAGCIPVLTATSGAAERLVDGVHAIKIERTAAALADAMMRVEAGEFDLEAMAARGRALASGDMAQSTWIDRLERLVLEDSRTGWQDGLDSPGVAAEVVHRHEISVRMLYARLSAE